MLMAMATTWALTRWRVALTLLLEAAGLRQSDVGAAPASAAPQSELDAAIAHLARSDWPRAFDELARLADAGHREGARIALLMAARGPRLFGRNFAVDAARRQRWLARASSSSATE